jgi:hypothetical protein
MEGKSAEKTNAFSLRKCEAFLDASIVQVHEWLVTTVIQ